MKLNYKSDFDFILTLYGENGESIGFPTYDWEAYIYTAGSKAYKYKASCRGGECVNCFNDNGKIHIVANNHGLSVGVLRVDFISYLPNSLYPDGTERVVQPIVIDIELVQGAGDGAEGGEAEAIIPYALVTSYDIAKANGYGGTQEEYNTALTRLPELKAEVDEVNALAEAIQEAGDAAAAAAEAASQSAAEAAERAQAVATEQALQAQRLTEVESSLADTTTAAAQNAADIAVLTEAGAVQSQRLAEVEGGVTALQSGKQDKLVSSEDILVDANVLRIADIAKKKVFIDMWNAACTINGKRWGWYDEEADDFLIYPDFRNGEGLHLTYEEAVKVYIVSHKGNVEVAEGTYFGDVQVEALLPLRILNFKQGSNLFHFQRQVKACAFVDAANLGVDSFSFMSYAAMFTGCVNLEEIYGNFYSSGTASLVVLFANCNKLREVRFYSIKTNFSVDSSPLLSLASFQYMLTRTNNDTAITITVHPDCYAKMTGDTTNAAAAALTEEEAAQWQQLLTDAVAKNITFATL